MKTSNQAGAAKVPVPAGSRWVLPVTLALLLLVLLALFHQSASKDKVLFSNDGPLGAMQAEQNRMPSIMTGLWMNLNWLGSEGVSPSPDISIGLLQLTGPELYGRVLVPASLFIVGICACFCFRRMGLAPLACILGGLAAALNSDFFSTSCWGVASQVVGFGMDFVALGLLASNRGRRSWIKTVLAGLAVGMGVMEAYDIGAIFSLFVAAFVIYQGVFQVEDSAPLPGKLGRSIGRLAVVAAFAGYLAIHALTNLIGTQVMGIVGMKQDETTRKEKWIEKTMWSFPKIEILQVIMPGIFGYRMDAQDGSNYWGTVGERPDIGEYEKMLKDPDERVRTQAHNYLFNSGNRRFSGTGYYAGVFVVVFALWAVAQSFRREGSPFTIPQRRAIWFWAVVVVVAQLMAFGKFAPFYRIFYSLPYASTIRCPNKFMHVVHFGLILLFGHGVHAVAKLLREGSFTPGLSLLGHLRKWRDTATAGEQRWMVGGFCVMALSFASWFAYAACNQRLVAYIKSTGIPEANALADVAYSLGAVGWFVLGLVVALLLLALIQSGFLAGGRAKWTGLALGVLVVLDLARADAPWIVYWDVPYKYAGNPIVDFLAKKPYEHRVQCISELELPGEQFSLFHQVYDIEWHQHLFPARNIQSLKVVMEPRVAELKDNFNRALQQPTNSPTFNVVRNWELTNTRYLLGLGQGFAEALNRQMDPVRKRFRLLQTFEIAAKEPKKQYQLMDFTAVPDTNGPLGLIEFTGALPRAKLYSNWRTMDETNALWTLGNTNFDPQALVLVTNALPPPNPADITQPAGTVEINPDYRPKRVALSADAKTPCVLLLNERFDPKWRVTVDGQATELLRCNYAMRGVFLKPGKHDVVFEFIVPTTALYVSLSAIVLGILISGWLACTKDDEP